MQLRKTLSLADTQLEIQDDVGIFSGYASKWDGVDSQGDTILKGAFAETIEKKWIAKDVF